MLSNQIAIPATAAGAAGFQIDNSCRFNRVSHTEGSNLLLIPTTAANNKKGTLSWWFKPGNLPDAGANTNYFIHQDNAANGNNAMSITWDTASPSIEQGMFTFTMEATSGAPIILKRTTMQLRDPHAWYHIHMFWNLEVTNSDSFGLYINGNPITNFVSDIDNGSISNVSGFGNTGTGIGKGIAIGKHPANNPPGGNGFLDGYLAQLYFQDGIVGEPINAGVFDDNGVWRPIDVSELDFGDQGWFLDFADSSDLGKDVSGNDPANSFTSNGLETNDQVSDSPANNFATISSISEVWNAAVTKSNGNLTVAGTAGTGFTWNVAVSSFSAVSSGKWIFATKPNATGSGNCDPWICNETGFNAKPANPPTAEDFWCGQIDSSSAFYAYDQGTTVATGWPASLATGDLILLAADIDNLKCWVGYYDVSTDTTHWADSETTFTGNPAAGTNGMTLDGTYFYFGVNTYLGRGGDIDFGQQAGIIDQITIPEGFEFLNTANLPKPTIADPSANFQVNLREGNAAAGDVEQTGNSQFGTDMILIKNRDQEDSWRLVDRVREATNELKYDVDLDVEAEDANGVTDFSSTDGYTIGTGAGGYNDDMESFVDYHWRGDGSDGGIGHTQGTISTTVNVNDDAGFSFGTYTGTGTAGTIGHGQSDSPDYLFIKNRSVSERTYAWHKDLTSGAYRILPAAPLAQTVDNGGFNSQAPGSDFIHIGSGPNTNLDDDDMVFYAWRSIPGFSSFSAYVGNGNTDGPLINLGFKPALLFIKNRDAGANWRVFDHKRAGYNKDNISLLPDSAQTEEQANEGTQTERNENRTPADVGWLDLLSNGFKIRIPSNNNGLDNLNSNNVTYIYMAWAESPFGGSDISPATAR